MLIAPAYKKDLLSSQAKVPAVDVCRDIYPCQVTYVYGAIGIGECCSNGGSIIRSRLALHILRAMRHKNNQI
jgi:hypothetical protein